MPDPIRQQLITDQVILRLGGSLTDPSAANTVRPGTAVYRSEVPSSPPLAPDGGGRVGPYLVWWPFGATPTRDEDLGDQTTDMDYGGQLDCVAGFVADLEALIDWTITRLYRWSPIIAGLEFGGFRPPVGYQPGAVRKNEAVNPPRYWVPLQFRTTVTR